MADFNVSHTAAGYQVSATDAGYQINATDAGYQVEEFTTVEFPTPDRYLDTRSGLDITDSIGSADAAIKNFPHIRLDHVSYGSNFGLDTNYTHNPAGDWTVLMLAKGVTGRTTQNYIQLANINGNTQNYIRTLISGSYNYAYYSINNTWRGGAKNVQSDANFIADFHLYGMTWNNSTQEVTTIFDGELQTVAVGGAVNSGSSTISITVSASRVAQVGMILVYSKKFTSQEMTDAGAGTFPSTSLEYLLYCNGDSDLTAVNTANDVMDVNGVQSNWSFGPPDDVFDYFNDNETWMGYLVKTGFTQRGTFQIPYAPDGSKLVTPDNDDIEHPAASVVHNMANSYIDGNPDNHSMDWATDADKIYAVFDKSNRTLWNVSIETANNHYIQNSDGNYTLWHPDELNEDFITTHAQSGHEYHLFCGLRTSGTDITGITKIAVYKENKS